MAASPVATERSKDDHWRKSRSGARAGAGFRYQDAVGVFLLVRCWSQGIPAEKITPESFDDFVIERNEANIWVQVKSKIAHTATFTAGEVARIILEGPGADEDERWVVLDRAFASFAKLAGAEAEPISTDITKSLCDSVKESERARLLARLRHTKVLIMPEPLVVAADDVSKEKSISRLAATACVSELLYRVGEAASENARTQFASRRSLTSASVESYCDNVLLLVDSSAIEIAAKRGVVTQLTFDEPDADPGFFSGVSAKPGHVVSGLVKPRPSETEAIESDLLSGRDTLICGPSGAGKSALCYLTAFSTRHVIRWFEVRNFNEEDRESVHNFLKGVAPNPSRPVALYVDDVGRGGEGAWEWLRSQARTIPGLRCLGSVRAEDFSLITGLYDVSVFRPKLSEDLAASIWENLKLKDQSKAAYWREAYEGSDGLMLEYVHILTQGQRLRDVIAEQVERRIKEDRDDELRLLPIVAAAGRFGTTVNIDALSAQLKLSNTAFARAYSRLRDEHLVGENESGTLRGIHEIRSQTIYEVCLEKLLLNGGSLSERAGAVVTPTEIRRYLTATGRAQVLDDATTIQVLVQRLEVEPSYHLLVEGLEALRLRTIMHEADAFNSIAKELNISHREYMLCMVIMHVDFDEGFSSSPAIEHLKKFRLRFEEERAADLRMTFLNDLPKSTFAASIEDCSSPAKVVRLASALHGDPWQKIETEVMSKLNSEIASGELQQIAEYLAILYESDRDASKVSAERLGGSNALLHRLWSETPWALEPKLENMADGGLELTVNILAIGENNSERPESFVNKHAARALQLCPVADCVNAKPLQPSGDALSIGDYTPGLKRLKHSVVQSEAAVSWNRMIIHAVASKNGAKSRTEVLERYRFGIEQAAKQTIKAIDVICRGKKFNPRQRHEAMALSIMEDLLPTYPMNAPEDQLMNPLGGDITDPIGTLIVDISEFLVALIDGHKSGYQLASYAEVILKSAPVIEAHPDWAYMSSAPFDALKKLKEAVSVFRPALVAAGHRGLRNSPDAFPVQRNVMAGKGLSRTSRRLDARWNDKKNKLALRIKSKTGAELYAKKSMKDDGVLWPDWELCVLKPSTSLSEYSIWLEESIGELREFSQKADLLVVAPLFGNIIPAQLAFRIYQSISPLPEEDFIEEWSRILPEHSFEESQTMKRYQRASTALVNLYTTQHLLAGKSLLKIETAQLETWGAEAREEYEQLVLSAQNDTNDAAEFAAQQIVKLNEEFTEGEEGDEGAATKYAQTLMSGIVSSEGADELNDIGAMMMVFISSDLNVPLDGSEEPLV